MLCAIFKILPAEGEERKIEHAFLPDCDVSLDLFLRHVLFHETMEDFSHFLQMAKKMENLCCYEAHVCVCGCLACVQTY
jgi:hypothetical protein